MNFVHNNKRIVYYDQKHQKGKGIMSSGERILKDRE